jgi:DNA-binding response OmpR family regulator
MSFCYHGTDVRETAMKILIAEDEKAIAQSLRKSFQEEGHQTMIAMDGEETFQLASKIEFDAILLDWRMPKMTGIEVCRKLRSADIETPIILLTALTDISNKVEALGMGADDYVTKPFSFEEVMARVLAAVRRFRQTITALPFNGLELCLISRSLKTPRGEVRLTEREFRLLRYFVMNKGSIVSREQLHEEVWQLPFSPSTNIVEVAVKNLRKKLEEHTGKKLIKTLYGQGYVFLGD